MNVRCPILAALAIILCMALAIPAGVAAQAAQSAGKITFVQPIVNVVRGPQQVPASATQEVFWGDVVNTGHLARGRISLTDGSLLSVGPDTNMTIAKHDPAAQQTDLDLNYGAVRAKAVKLVKPDAHFRVRTPVGVAGVVGTEMIVLFGTDGQMHVFCMEGTCQVCDTLLNCVLLKGGEVSSLRTNQPPSQPSPPTPANLTTAVNASGGAGAGAAGGGAAGAGGAAGGGAGAGAGIGAGAAVGIGAGVAAAVATVVVRSVATTKTCSTAPPTTGGVTPRANCVNRAGAPRLPGQK